jgi:2-keto-4-pentenoate hydratase/2-oxohepta-3-ene-1,7-dioic acid hydratase in catechol pathway
MKLATLRTHAGTTPVSVVTDSGPSLRFVDLRRAAPELPATLRQLLSLEGGLHQARQAHQRGVEAGTYTEGSLLAPIPEPGKILCIGLNYADHAAESGVEPPEEPVCFSKFGNTIIGPEQPIRLPSVATQVDYEAELVAVIGRRGFAIPREKAFEYVAGYTNGHDVSARDWQIGRPGKQWLLGKTPDTFAPIGPWLVTADEVPDPHDLRIQLRLNGETMQDSRTREFIFGIDQIIAHVSQLMTLEPGDLIFTGTPPGVGMARDPQVWLKAGDRVQVEIEGLGILSNPVEAGD